MKENKEQYEQFETDDKDDQKLKGKKKENPKKD